MSDCNTPILRSNVAESVTEFGSPEESVGSVYSTVKISPCKTQYTPAAGAISNLSVTAVPPPSVATNNVVPTLGVGHLLSAGPSVYRISKSSSKMPALGAISVIGPISRTPAPPALLSPTSMVPSSATGPPAYARVPMRIL